MLHGISEISWSSIDFGTAFKKLPEAGGSTSKPMDLDTELQIAMLPNPTDLVRMMVLFEVLPAASVSISRPPVQLLTGGA